MRDPLPSIDRALSTIDGEYFLGNYLRRTRRIRLSEQSFEDEKEKKMSREKERKKIYFILLLYFGGWEEYISKEFSYYSV